MYTVVFVDGWPLQIKIRFMKAPVSSPSCFLCGITTSAMLIVKKTLIKILINTGNQ